MLFCLTGIGMRLVIFALLAALLVLLQCGSVYGDFGDRWYCRCGTNFSGAGLLGGCRQCGGGGSACTGAVTTYFTEQECVDECIPHYGCSANTCNVCCGSGCPPSAVEIDVENPDDSFSLCLETCMPNYFCTPGGCQVCYADECPATTLFSSEGSCTSECRAHYYYNGDRCDPCFGGGCPETNFGDDVTCGGECEICTYGDWGRWSYCTAKCNGGIRTRTRSSVVTGSSSGCANLEQSAVCGYLSCPINCRISPWSLWSTCVGQCGTGVMTRYRVLIIPAMFNGHCPFHHSDFIQRRSCRTGRPCVDEYQLD